MLSPAPSPSPETESPAEPSRQGHLTDDRLPGQWGTRYPARAWAQIAFELIYLVIGLGLALALLYQLAVSAHSINGPDLWRGAFRGESRHTLALGAVAVSGACGGFSFALKWLYHSVAYGWWNTDRIIWRLVVPVLAATLAFFTALMISAGFIPIFNAKIADGPRVGTAYGFFAGFFSDNLLAALQRVADQVLGTLGRVEGKQQKRKDAP